MAIASQLSDLDTYVSDEVVLAQRDRLARMLRDVMQTLAGSCPSDQHRKLYNAAHAMIAEAGLVMDEGARERQTLAYAVWEAGRR